MVEVGSDGGHPDWQSLVPEVTLRPQQNEALPMLWEALYGSEAVDFATLEAPTGVGKSVILLALARWVEREGGRAFLVTPQRVLQDQLAVWDGVAVMKGKGSYSCNIAPTTAASAPCALNAKVREGHEECSDKLCPYFRALAKAKATPIVIHNYASLMAQSHIGGHFGPRDLMCLDEAHTAASWVRNYMSCEFTLSDLRAMTAKDPPQDPDLFMPWLRLLIGRLGDEIPNNFPERVIAHLLKIRAHSAAFGVPNVNEMEGQHGDEMRDLDPEDRVPFEAWAMDRLGESCALVPWATIRHNVDTDDEESWEVLPLRIAPLSTALTGLGGKIVMTTATVLSPKLLAAEAGVSNHNIKSIIIDSAFHPDSRPVYRRYVGKMSYAHKKRTLPRMIDELVEIAAEHNHEQGLVHTVSHALAWQVSDRLRKRLRGRPVVQLPRGSDRDVVIKDFLSGTFGPTAILIGPGLMEGVDGVGDSCRWQAMCKAPWPHRKDPVVCHLMDNKDPKIRRWGDTWYVWKTAQLTVQGIGRVCRSNDDHGVTYLLDSGFKRILTSGFVPDYVIDAVS